VPHRTSSLGHVSPHHWPVLHHFPPHQPTQSSYESLVSSVRLPCHLTDFHMSVCIVHVISTSVGMCHLYDYHVIVWTTTCQYVQSMSSPRVIYMTAMSSYHPATSSFVLPHHYLVTYHVSFVRLPRLHFVQPRVTPVECHVSCQYHSMCHLATCQHPYSAMCHLFTVAHVTFILIQVIPENKKFD